MGPGSHPSPLLVDAADDGNKYKENYINKCTQLNSCGEYWNDKYLLFTQKFKCTYTYT